MSRKLRTCLILFLFHVIAFSAIRASVFAEEIALTLDEAIVIALRDNRSIRLQAQDIERAKAQLENSKSDRWPTLTFSATEQHDKGYYPADISSTVTQTSIRQYLYKGGSIMNSIDKANYDLQAAKAATARTRNDIILAVTKTFCATLLAQEYARLNKAIADNTILHLTFIQARYEKGQASENDLLQLKNSLENVKAVHEESVNQITALEEILRNLLFLTNDVIIKARGTLAYEPRDLLYDEGFLQALATRPEIKEYEAKEKANIRSVEIAKADGRPSVYASWDYYSRSHILSTASKNWNDNMVIGLTFSWPIFDGWGTKAKVDQAIADLKQTQILKEKLIKDIALELKNAYIALNDAVSKLRASEAQIAWYESSAATTAQQYNKGLTSQLDVADAMIGLDVARFNKIQATYDYLIAHANFVKATGGM